MRKIAVALACCLLLASCDSVELDDRGIVIALGIDRAEEGLKVSAELPDHEGEHFIVTGQGDSLSAAMHDIDRQIRHSLYLGHTRVLIISDDILKDKTATENILKTLEENNDISGRVIMLSAENAEDILNVDAGDMTGIYISSFYDYAEDTPKLDFTDFCIDFYSRKNAEVPNVSLLDGNIVIGESSRVDSKKEGGKNAET